MTIYLYPIYIHSIYLHGIAIIFTLATLVNKRQMAQTEFPYTNFSKSENPKRRSRYLSHPNIDRYTYTQTEPVA
jgi:hypothetical protein